MANSTNIRYETLSNALAIIDPEGILAPGTEEHNRVTETILAWMDAMEPDEVLRMSKKARSLFNLDKPQLQVYPAPKTGWHRFSKRRRS